MQLLVTSISYAASPLDAKLATKKNGLSLSVVAGSSLLTSQILKRIDFESSDFSTSDEGHSLNVSTVGKQGTLINSARAAEGERIGPWSDAAKWIKCLGDFPSNAFRTQAGSDAINLTLHALSVTTAVSLAAALAQTNPTSDQTNPKHIYRSSGKSLYLANANGSTLVSDDDMLTLTVASYATCSDITTALASYATSTQLFVNRLW